jgi:hypothetical protein
MLSPKSVIPECCIDSCLFNVLLNFEKEGVNHTKGNGTVVKKIEEKFGDLFCVGIVDKDKQPLRFIEQQCQVIDVGEFQEYFLIYKRNGYHHYIIKMVPAIEEWILNISDKLNLSLAKSQIEANNLKQLCDITKKIVSKDDARFKDYFRRMIAKADEIDFKPVIKLKNIIKLILQKNYKLDINELKNV